MAAENAGRTAGSVVRSRQWPGLSVDEVLMPRGLRVPEHRHAGAQLYFLLEGRYLEALGDDEHVLAPGAIWFRDPGMPHRNAVLGGTPALTLIVTAEAARLRWLARHGPGGGPVPALLLADLRTEVLRELRAADAAASTALEGWALLLLSRVERARVGLPAAAPPWLDEAVSFIERRYGDPIALAQVAAAAGVQSATLAAAFRRFLGTSVGERIRAVRLRHARRALVETRVPIHRIAVDCGFFDQAHLGRWCRRELGLSPQELRRRAGIDAADAIRTSDGRGTS